jgi:acylphosphatase
VDRDELLRVLRAFQDSALEYVLIGAAAMGVHGVIRATEDVDIFINATEENVERLRQAFKSAYPRGQGPGGCRHDQTPVWSRG